MTSKSRMDATTASSPSQTSANLGDNRKKLPRRLKHVSPSEKEEQQLPFPQKLYMMLESVDRLGLTHTASWLPGGRSFIVKDPIQFMDLTVPHFFKATKFRSFQRQLNLWGFHRISKGRENGWYHETFIRGCPEMLTSIYRTKIKGTVLSTGHKQASTFPDLMHSPSLSADSFDMNVEEEVLQGSEYDSSVSADTIQVSNTTSPEVSRSDDAFDEKVKALFSTPIKEFPQRIERLVTLDGSSSSTTQVDEAMSFQPRVSNDNQSEHNDALANSRNTVISGETWDAMPIEIEPLPIDCFNVLGSETQTKNANLDDFQQFLGRLIK
ncbi:heat shock factor family protein [Skeletonema marinoi]|uniref:Heat shock factor family protein n=1 Tax=Skeletonema marinoi TaxID=267567 RepID=A0AAD8Y4V9_9STRA|nr:heat shock factor family protein [Skeletonema marinoi]